MSILLGYWEVGGGGASNCQQIYIIALHYITTLQSLPEQCWQVHTRVPYRESSDTGSTRCNVAPAEYYYLFITRSEIKFLPIFTVQNLILGIREKWRQEQQAVRKYEALSLEQNDVLSPELSLLTQNTYS